MVVERQDKVGTIIVAPCGFEGRILVIIRCRVRRCVVYTYQSVEAQTLQQRVEVDIHAGVKLELTACPLALSGCMVVGKDIGTVGQRTTEEVLTVDDVARRRQGIHRLCGIRIDIRDRNQRSHTVRTPCGSYLPVVQRVVITILLVGDGRLLVIIGSIGIHEGRDVLVDLHINVTTHIETIGIVVLSLSEV